MGYYNTEYLEHHGILGQKWGVRRFQDKNGNLTSEGKQRYNRDKTLNNIGRALTNTSLGQRLAVNLNKGYRQDKKEIKGLYKEKKEEIGKDKEQKKNLKSDYKKTLGEARTTAAQVNYAWQSDEANKKIQTQSVGKTFITSYFLGGYGNKKMNEVKANTDSTGDALLTGVLHSVGNYATMGLLGLGEYAYGRSKMLSNEKSATENTVQKKNTSPVVMLTSSEAKKAGLDKSTRLSPQEESDFWKAYAAQIDKERK